MAISSAENIFKSFGNKTADVTFNSGMKKAAEVISVVDACSWLLWLCDTA